ncbi:MAG: Omp28-related outer membrane protein [Bacteroidales bacterium]|nr:Omp28-related outer membrane protein [Bacteroidales bacterium]
MKKLLLSLVVLCMAFAASAQQPVFYENFDNVNTDNGGIGTLPTGWTSIKNDALANYSNINYFSDAWTVVNFSGSGRCAACITKTTTGGAVDRWLITPAITVADTNNIVEFMAAGGGATNPEILSIYVSTTGTNMADFTDTLLFRHQFGVGTSEYSWINASLAAYAGQTIHLALVANTADEWIMRIDEFRVYSPVPNEIQLASISIPSMFPINTNANVTGTIVNNGGQPLTSFDMQYTVNGGTPVVQTVTGINVPSRGSYDFTFSTPLNMAAPGAVNVVVTISNPNGEADFDASDNQASASGVAYDASAAVPRTSLLEHFTTTKCPNCPGGHDRVHAALATRPNVIWMCHHAGYYTDVMTTQDDEALCWFYNSGVNGGTYAPAIMLDRTHFSFSDEQSPIFFPDANVGTCIDEALNVPAFVSCNITNVNFDEASRTLTATVSGTFGLELPGARVSLYLVEDSIIASQSGGSSRYQHDNVYRAALSALYGDAIASTNAGDNYTKTYTWTMPASFKAWRTRLVAFVSNYNASDPTDCLVYNADQSQNIVASYVGINEVGSNMTCNVFPNPATTVANIVADAAIEEVVVVNMMGQVVYKNNNVNAESLTINTEKMAAGMYTVTVKSANGVATQRLTVVK